MSVLVAMSGGVDSSAAAYLCKLRHEVCRGATMLLVPISVLQTHGISQQVPSCVRRGFRGGCLTHIMGSCFTRPLPASPYAGEEKIYTSINDARKVCDVLGIAHEVLDCRALFAEKVINNFVRVYESGGTPNPCVECNKFLKFGAFMRHAEGLGIEKIATGHYALIERTPSGRYMLRKAEDSARDQSYVLYSLTQSQLARVEFPLGGITKPEVRELAAGLGFVNAKKTDSQDICFVPDGDYGGFIEGYTGRQYPSGKFVDSSGRELGTHKGIIHYTAGQRRGLGVAAGSRLYVSEIDGGSNTITLAAEGEESLYAKGVRVRDVNLIAFDILPENLRACVKTRYRQREIACVVNQSGEGELVIEFAERQRMPARGQAAVIYDGEYVLGGGTIYETI